MNSVKMSNYQRVKQYLTFSRQWHIVNAKWQDPFLLAPKVAAVLDGRHKPVFSPEVDCGDHVIIYNCHHVAMKAFNWRRIDYFYNNMHPKGRNCLPAWEIHQSDSNRVMWMAVYSELRGPFNTRRRNCQRLHLISDEKIPSELLQNVSSQMRQAMPQPKTFDEYTKEEKESFPKLFEWPEDFVFEPGNKKE